MNEKTRSRLTGNAQALRKNMTKEERHLWYDFLKTLPITVNRQKVIDRYIVDFYCAAAKIIIELDGAQHYHAIGLEQDKQRDASLRRMGYTVLRYSNTAVRMNFDGVCADIWQHIEAAMHSVTSSTASGPPSPQGEG